MAALKHKRFSNMPRNYTQTQNIFKIFQLFIVGENVCNNTSTMAYVEEML